MTADGAKLRVIRETIINNKKLEILNMNECQLGEDGAYYFAQGLQTNSTLHALNIATNNFGDEGVKNIALSMAAHGFKLKHLDLSNNFISDEVGTLFAEGLQTNKTLLSLSLAENTLTETSGLALLEAIKLHPQLSRIDLSKNLIPIKIILEMKKYCDRNNEKTDPRQVPRLVQQHQQLKQNRIKKVDFHKVENELNHFRRLEETDWDQIERTKQEFWAVFYRSKTEVELLLRAADATDEQLEIMREKHAEVVASHRQLEEAHKEERRFERMKISAM